jgi:6-phosphofructokinase 1
MCVKYAYVVCNRAPLDNVNGAMEESWNGYVHDDDRALLKVFC